MCHNGHAANLRKRFRGTSLSDEKSGYVGDIAAMDLIAAMSISSF
jgi:hypothetical protein